MDKSKNMCQLLNYTTDKSREVVTLKGFDGWGSLVIFQLINSKHVTEIHGMGTQEASE